MFMYYIYSLSVPAEILLLSWKVVKFVIWQLQLPGLIWFAFLPLQHIHNLFVCSVFWFLELSSVISAIFMKFCLSFSALQYWFPFMFSYIIMTEIVPLFLITSLPAHWIRLKHVFDIPYRTSSLSYRYKDYNFFFKENLLILPSLIFLLCSLLLFWEFCWNMFLKPIQLPFKFLNKPVSWEIKTSKHRPM